MEDIVFEMIHHFIDGGGGYPVTTKPYNEYDLKILEVDCPWLNVGKTLIKRNTKNPPAKQMCEYYKYDRDALQKAYYELHDGISKLI